jgi:hypothetical protein
MKRSYAAVAAVALLATACGPAKQLKLDMRPVAVDIPRVVTPAVELVPPPTVQPPAALPRIPSINRLATPPPVAATPTPTPPVDPCPTADPFAVPAVPATLTVAAPPVDATTTQIATGSVSGVVTMTTMRLPSQVSSVGQHIDSWRVVRRGPAKNARSVEVYRLVHPSSSPLATAAGIYLVALSWDDPARGKVTFEASANGLEVLSLPAQPSTNDAQYAGTDTDPDTLTTLTLVRNIRSHKRIDACGHLIDTLTVEMSGTLTTPTMQRQVAWTQQLATSYGAVDVAETLTLTSLGAGYTWTRTLRSTTVPKRPKDTA